jgi:hypothetical protein
MFVAASGDESDNGLGLGLTCRRIGGEDLVANLDLLDCLMFTVSEQDLRPWYEAVEASGSPSPESGEEGSADDIPQRLVWPGPLDVASAQHCFKRTIAMQVGAIVRTEGVDYVNRLALQQHFFRKITYGVFTPTFRGIPQREESSDSRIVTWQILDEVVPASAISHKSADGPIDGIAGRVVATLPTAAPSAAGAWLAAVEAAASGCGGLVMANVDDALAAAVGRTQAVRVAERGRVVGGVGVGVALLGVGQVLDGVGGDESADGWVVVAGAELIQAGGGVFGPAEVAAVGGGDCVGAAAVGTIGEVTLPGRGAG